MSGDIQYAQGYGVPFDERDLKVLAKLAGYATVEEWRDAEQKRANDALKHSMFAIDREYEEMANYGPSFEKSMNDANRIVMSTPFGKNTLYELWRKNNAHRFKPFNHAKYGVAMNEQEYEKSLDIPMANALVQSGHIGTVVCVDSKHFERLAEERVLARGVWAQLKRLRDSIARIHSLAHDADLCGPIKPVPDAPPLRPPVPVCAEKVHDPYAHDWAWDSLRFNIRGDGDAEHSCVCRRCSRVGKAVPWPGEQVEAWHTIGKAKVVAW